MSGGVHGCKTCGGSHFGHNDCPFAEIAEASSKGETSAVTAAEKPEKELERAAGSAETGGEKAAPKAHFVSKFPEAVHKYDDRCDQCNVGLDGWIPCDKCDIAVCSHKCLDAHECPASNFPGSSQNQAVSSGVEGAHEGTTADEKAELPREHQCVSANDCPLCDEYVPPKSDSREPEKLNNAQKSESIMSESQSMQSKLFWLRGNLCDRHFNLYTMSSGDCPACLLLKYGGHLSGCKRLEPSSTSEVKECDCGWSNYESVALAESSLSSPPPKDQDVE